MNADYGLRIEFTDGTEAKIQRLLEIFVQTSKLKLLIDNPDLYNEISLLGNVLEF